MPDYLRDWRDLIRHSDGSPLKQQRLLKKIDKFERICRRAGGDVNRFPQAKLVQAMCEDGHGDFKDLMFKMVIARLTRGEFSDWSGWEYRNAWAEGSYSHECQNPRWRLEPVESIAVLGEQGIGDEIMYGSCIPDLMLRVPKVVFECDPRLVDVFARSLGIETKPRLDITQRGDPVIQYLTMKREEAAFIPVGDLPRLFRKHRSHFPGKPFLKPLPEMIEKWAHLKGRTGLAWRSRTGKTEPEAFGVKDPVCLQYDAWEFETTRMTVPECDLHNDIEDILGICANLERIVTVGQTIVHLAGSIGTKVDVVLPPIGSSRVTDIFRWRYIKPHMPWYPSVNVYDSIGEYRRNFRANESNGRTAREGA